MLSLNQANNLSFDCRYNLRDILSFNSPNWNSTASVLKDPKNANSKFAIFVKLQGLSIGSKYNKFSDINADMTPVGI